MFSTPSSTSQELTAAIQPPTDQTRLIFQSVPSICYAPSGNELTTEEIFQQGQTEGAQFFNPAPVPTPPAPAFTDLDSVPPFLETTPLVEVLPSLEIPPLTEAPQAFTPNKSNLPSILTADFNPKIQLRGGFKSPIDFSIIGYSALISYMGSLLISNDYIPTADEVRKLLETLPAGLPITTSVQSFDANGNAQYDFRWYSLSADGTFESTAYTDWQLFQARWFQLSQSAPIAQAVDDVTEIQITPQSQVTPGVVEQTEVTAPAGKAPMTTLVEDVVVQPYQFEPASLQVEQSVEPVQVDMSAIAPIKTSEFQLGDAEFWRRLDKKTVMLPPGSTPLEVQLTFGSEEV
ncbi:hypothetical protein H6F51_18185 [Cyanobacteria bacterium FACHB-DQ100]|nr:hypothetical protein [Cyanobacteria bacterium FACHB-DQ100]